MTERELSPLDRLLAGANKALQTLDAGHREPHRPNPAPPSSAESELDDAERRHVAGLMRVNHAGEVCAQALYEGQALTARDPRIREAMQRAASEETDHLAWCEDRLRELDARTTVLNPLWYGLSLGVGALAGIAGDRWSLGFVAETERQVCRHLEEHLRQLPEDDERTRAILEKMHADEAGHATTAVEEGAAELPLPVRHAMSLVSKLMTRTSYHV